LRYRVAAQPQLRNDSHLPAMIVLLHVRRHEIIGVAIDQYETRYL
jgi:hypothetical protein